MRSQQQLASGAAASDLMTDFALSFASQAACSAGLSYLVIGRGCWGWTWAKRRICSNCSGLKNVVCTCRKYQFVCCCQDLICAGFCRNRIQTLPDWDQHLLCHLQIHVVYYSKLSILSCAFLDSYLHYGTAALSVVTRLFLQGHVL